MGKLAFWGGVAGAAKGAQQAIQLGVQERWRKQDQMREERLMKLRQQHDKSMQGDRHKYGTSEREAEQAFAAGQAETGHENAVELANIRGQHSVEAVERQYEALRNRDQALYNQELNRPGDLAERYNLPPERFLPAGPGAGARPDEDVVGFGVRRIGKLAQTTPPERDEKGNVVSLGGQQDEYVYQLKGVAGEFVDYNNGYINKDADPVEIDKKMEEAQTPQIINGKKATMSDGTVLSKEAYAVANFRLATHTEQERLKIRTDFYRVWKYVPDGMY